MKGLKKAKLGKKATKVLMKMVDAYKLEQPIHIKRVKMKELGGAINLEYKTLIQIQKGLKGVDLRKVIIHELTHAKQFEQDGFDLFANGEATWKGITLKNFNKVEYLERPWEIEAFANENIYQA